MLKRAKGIGLRFITALSALLVLSCSQPAPTVAPVFTTLFEAGEEFSFRGLHAVHDSVVVVGGTQGSICKIEPKLMNDIFAITLKIGMIRCSHS